MQTFDAWRFGVVALVALAMSDPPEASVSGNRDNKVSRNNTEPFADLLLRSEAASGSSAPVLN